MLIDYLDLPGATRVMATDARNTIVGEDDAVPRFVGCSVQVRCRTPCTEQNRISDLNPASYKGAG